MSLKIFWAGDSTVKENTILSFPQTGIGQVFKLFLKPEVRVFNYAQNGRSTKSFIEEGRLELIEQQIKEGDFLFIQFGHNDEKIQDDSRYTTPYGTFQENLKKFVDVARNVGAYPVIITPLYRRLFNDDHKTLIDDTHLEYPDAMKEFAVRENVPLIDLCTLSRQLIEEAGYGETFNWFMHFDAGVYANYPEGKVDNTHLQYLGAVKFATIIAKELYKLGGIYADLLIDPEDNLEDPRLLID
ncbi:MAG: rhamnogalacturonan acetylesterase [Lachnospiraceae bacterium]|nr:rhamnogalacturonan acetylesterase [Lachnospiraceae bacterium]